MSLAGKRVLVVEDEAVVAMMVEDLLLGQGCQVVGPAATVEEALALIEAFAIDLGVLDVNLNGERSTRVAAAMRARSIPVVLATGYGAPPDAEFAGLAVIQKPYRDEDMVTRLLEARAA